MKIFTAAAISVLTVFFTSQLFAQSFNEYDFLPWTNPEVSENNVKLRNAWAGGLNNVQAGKIDFDGDGIQDLVLFDRHGDRLLPFRYNPAGLSPGFNYSPEYRKYFPPVNHWMQLIDYNHDGRTDIFTYTPGGIMVYRNTGTVNPVFEQAVHPYITSLQGSIFTNLLVTYVDFPAIADLDGDGDYDILTFWGLGSFVELHKNMSIEQFGNSDSLIYHKTSNCWGRFAESDESNIISFDTCADFDAMRYRSTPKHTGSTFLLTDIDLNGTDDLVLGDVDYNTVAALINEGNAMDALITEQLPAWPVAEPVDLWSFPLVQEIDLYGDGLPYLMASPFDPGLYKSEGFNSVWLYTDCKSEKSPADCGLLTRSFLQDGMIENGLGAVPVFDDVNGDGLTDLIVGNYGLFDTCVLSVYGQLKCDYTGRMKLYLNTGTSQQPAFSLLTDDFAGVSHLGLTGVHPAFTDLDGDGDIDLLLGNAGGDFWMFTNIAGSGSIPEFGEPVSGFQNLSAGSFSTPVFADLNNDGLVDLVSGSASGKLFYYRNTGTQFSPLFELVSDFFGQVNVTDPEVSYTGHSVPFFFRNREGALRLLVGSESGQLKYYRDITTVPGEAFVLADPHFMYISEGIRTAPAMEDLNGDGHPDLAVGNYSGGITLFRGVPPGPTGFEHKTDSQGLLLILPNPGKGSFNFRIEAGGCWELALYNAQGNLVKAFSMNGYETVRPDLSHLSPGLYTIKAGKSTDPRLIIMNKLMIIR